MADHVVGHHAPMPGAGETSQAVVATHLPRRQFACLHNDNRPESLQDDGRGEFSLLGLYLLWRI
jgi:hypothetical protein